MLKKAINSMILMGERHSDPFLKNLITWQRIQKYSY